MNLLYVITRGSKGGAQQNVLSLALGMKARGHAVAVACGDTDGPLLDALREAGVATRHLRTLGRSWNPLKNLALVAETRRLVAELRPEVVHFHSSNSLFGALGAQLAKPKPKIVFTLHGWSILHPAWRGPALLKLAYGLAMRTLLKFTDFTVYVSEADRRFGETRGLTRPGRAVVIWNGLSPDLAFHERDAARHTLGLTPERFAVGTVARIDYPKNLGLLVSAAARLKNRPLDAVVLGDGPERMELERDIFVNGLNGRFRILNNLSEQSPLLTGLDCFVICSRFEGLPYSLLEAMLAGVPVVATTVGGIPEVIEHGVSGRLVPPGDAVALAREIAWVMDHPEEARAMAAAARSRVQKDFTEAAMVEKTGQIYQSIASSRWS